MERAPLDVAALRDALAPRWTRVDVVAETPSTNSDLLARADLADRTVLAAELQTSGRGRFDRVWTSPVSAGLTFSVAVVPSVPIARLGWLPLLAGVALAEAVADLTDVPAALKWPNDLLLGPERRKAAGILAQTAGDSGIVVVGIGLNVSTTRDELPVPTATSLAEEGVTDLDRTALLASILLRLDARAAQWADFGGDAEACGLAAAYRELCATIGTPVRVAGSDGSTLDGAAVDVDVDGHLLVDLGGEMRVVAAGDVEHVRPA